MNLFHDSVETLHATSPQSNPAMSQVPILTIRNLSAVFPDNNGGLQALEGNEHDREQCKRHGVAHALPFTR